VRPAQADDFVAAHLLARICVAELVGGSAADVVITQTCATCGGPHGQPSVTGLPAYVSWSHAGGHILAAAADRPVGVDLEPVRLLDIDRRLVATAAELAVVDAADDPGIALLRLWVAKEALAKLAALTLDEFAAVSVGSLTDFAVRSLDYPGFVAALAVAASE